MASVFENLRVQWEGETKRKEAISMCQETQEVQEAETWWSQRRLPEERMLKFWWVSRGGLSTEKGERYIPLDWKAKEMWLEVAREVSKQALAQDDSGD